MRLIHAFKVESDDIDWKTTKRKEKGGKRNPWSIQSSTEPFPRLPRALSHTTTGAEKRDHKHIYTTKSNKKINAVVTAPSPRRLRCSRWHYSTPAAKPVAGAERTRKPELRARDLSFAAAEAWRGGMKKFNVRKSPQRSRNSPSRTTCMRAFLFLGFTL